MRRYRKRDGRSLLDLSQEMIEEVAGWLPDHSFILSCDGAYSSLAGRDLPPHPHRLPHPVQRRSLRAGPAPPAWSARPAASDSRSLMAEIREALIEAA
jgi:hypothetical protein